MRKALVPILFMLLSGCANSEKKSSPKEGIWQARLEVKDKQILPFNIELSHNEGESIQLKILNGEETILVDEISVEGDSILIKAPVFEGYISAKLDSEYMDGVFVIESLDRTVPFEAEFGIEERFSNVTSNTTDATGIWETEFSPGTDDSYMGKGIFSQKNGIVSGTFRTTTGDYRFLEGVMDKDSLKVSAFDGAHAFLFQAKVTDSTMNGVFYSGNHFKEPFMAVRNENYELPSPDSLTFIKEGYDKFDFSFPNLAGEMVSLSDPSFKDKVVIVQLMGSWCPNCLDESKFLVEYLKNHTTGDLAVLALAFEQAKTKERALKSIQRLKDRIGISYPILLAQYGSYDKEKAQQKLPMLNHVLSYPTTIFVDKKGDVRKIHTGFNGPATGDKYEEFKVEFDSFIKELLSE
ncbi:TlpA disulfide reductase family protein [Maribacter aurantiacus]|uniref:TlpA family protein disulfide reductase n=1 Tax=Maribacter aurantiacus TaxID=1882343 RepID=A0A5R8M5Y9_9FLAO|nr:TlpA disulfide reductase family protein [Maribacter aurantiacus]TLF44981.1 TlpA family protein disulfide reductase [Maribacter aurantiacus]